MAGRLSAVINIGILGDNSKFRRAIQDSSSKLEAFAGKVGRTSVNVAKGFGVMTVAAGGLAAVVGKQLFDVGEELVALDQKIGTVFSGQSLDQVTGWADEVAARMGLTATQAAGLAANAGDLLKPMGFTADEAASMSTEIVGLSAALSEWSGGQRSVEETAAILQKALLGERESLKELGISINQAEVDQRALTIAMEDGRDAITAQDKALATQQLIFERSTDAQEAFAAGGNNLTAAQNRLRAAVGELQEDMARKLMPVFSRAAEIVVELIDVFEKDGLGGVISNVSERIKAAWPAIKTQLGKWAQGFLDWVKQVGPPFLAALGAWLVDVGKWFVDDALPVIVEKLGEWTGALLDWAVDAVPPLLEKLGDLIADVADWFSEDGLDTIVTKVGEWAAALVEWVAPMIPPLLKELGGLLADIAFWIVGTALPNLARDLGEWSAAFIGWVFGVAPDLLRALGGLLASLGGWIIDTGIPSLFRAGLDLGGGLIDGLLNALGATLSGLGGIAEDIVNAIIRLFNSQVIDRINGLLEFSFWTPFGTQTINPDDIPHIPELADGGIVTGPTLALIGEAGPEAVIPLDRAGGMGGGSTYQITVNTGVGDAGQIGSEIVDAITAYERRNGSGWRAA